MTCVIAIDFALASPESLYCPETAGSGWPGRFLVTHDVLSMSCLLLSGTQPLYQQFQVNFDIAPAQISANLNGLGFWKNDAVSFSISQQNQVFKERKSKSCRMLKEKSRISPALHHLSSKYYQAKIKRDEWGGRAPASQSRYSGFVRCLCLPGCCELITRAVLNVMIVKLKHSITRDFVDALFSTKVCGFRNPTRNFVAVLREVTWGFVEVGRARLGVFQQTQEKCGSELSSKI